MFAITTVRHYNDTNNLLLYNMNSLNAEDGGWKFISNPVSRLNLITQFINLTIGCSTIDIKSCRPSLGQCESESSWCTPGVPDANRSSRSNAEIQQYTIPRSFITFFLHRG